MTVGTKMLNAVLRCVVASACVLLAGCSVLQIGRSGSCSHKEYWADDFPPHEQGGTGSLLHPWDLQTALNGGDANHQVKPGDTIWLKGGRYRGYFVSLLRGTQACPITVRAVDNQRVVIDSFTPIGSNCPDHLASMPDEKPWGKWKDVIHGGSYCACRPNGNPDDQKADDCNVNCVPYFNDADVTQTCKTTCLPDFAPAPDCSKIPKAHPDQTLCNPSYSNYSTDLSPVYAALFVPQCSHDVRFAGLELTTSEPGGRRLPKHYANFCASHGGYAQRGCNGGGLVVEGSHITVINAIIHDGHTGVTVAKSADDFELLGSLIFNNGLIDTHPAAEGAENPTEVTWSHGQALYMQGVPGGKIRVTESVLWNNFSNNFQLQLSEGKSARLEVDKTIVLNAGGPVGASYRLPILRSPSFQKHSGSDAPSIRIRSSEFAYAPGLGAGGQHLDVGNTIRLEMSYSYLSGAATPVTFQHVKDVSFHHNVIVRKTCNRQPLTCDSPTDPACPCVEKALIELIDSIISKWDDNQYFDTSHQSGKPVTTKTGKHDGVFGVGKTTETVTPKNWDTWQTQHDTGGSWKDTLPATRVAVHPVSTPKQSGSQEEYGHRAHIIIYNWDLQHRVSFQLDKAQLAPGAAVAIYDLQRLGFGQNATHPLESTPEPSLEDFLGEPVWSGTYIPNQPVSIVMRENQFATPPIGLVLKDHDTQLVRVPHTAPDIGAYLLLATPPS